MSNFKNSLRLAAVRSLLAKARIAHRAVVQAKHLKWYGAYDDAKAKRDAVLREAREVYSHITTEAV